MEKQQQARQAIQRKPLPKLPADGQPAGNASSTPPQQRPPPPHVNTTEQQLRNLQLRDGAPGSSAWGVGVPPQRQGTTSTIMTTASSNAPTLYSTRTQDTAITTPSPADASPPALPRRPLPGAGQFGTGITASPSQMTPTSTNSSSAVGGNVNANANSNGDANGKADGKGKEPSIWKTAFDETRFFAGGLIQKPYESTKHYTVMRHSSGLVMYRGPTTNVVVTVFSTPDHPIPADRSVWLQRRGFSGDTGLKLKTLVGASGSWLDVTPERRAAAGELPAADERGYQRDIAKLMKRASGKHVEKALANRRPRETLVVRIPAACADGYFRMVVCTGGAAAGAGAGPSGSGATTTTKRKVLCGSPVFRIASTSTDSSIFRGASLSTLPVEAGVKIASMLGTSYVANAAAPIVSTVQDQVSKYQPGFVETTAAQTMYDNSRLASKVGEAGESYDQSREAAYQAYMRSGGGGEGASEDGEDDAPPEVIGADSGPEKPFPVQFQGRVVRGTGRSAAELGVPTANLADVPDDVRLRMRGVYFGWAAIAPGKASGGAAAEDGRVTHDWIEAVVTVGPSPWGPTSRSVVVRNDVAAHLLYDFGGAAFVDAKIKVILMGFLRPAAAGAGASSPASNDDALLVVASLSRPAWGPQATLALIETEKSGRSLSDKYVDTRGKLQKHVDRIPVHWAGVRTSAGEMRDQLYGNGGFWVPR